MTYRDVDGAAHAAQAAPVSRRVRLADVFDVVMAAAMAGMLAGLRPLGGPTLWLAGFAGAALGAAVLTVRAYVLDGPHCLAARRGARVVVFAAAMAYMARGAGMSAMPGMAHDWLSAPGGVLPLAVLVAALAGLAAGDAVRLTRPPSAGSASRARMCCQLVMSAAMAYLLVAG
jgi:hypothetical protein